MNKFSQKGQIAVVLILCLAVLTGIALSGGMKVLWNNANDSQNSNPLISPEPPVIGKPVLGSKEPSKNNLQIGTFNFELLTPTPVSVNSNPQIPPSGGSICAKFSIKRPDCECDPNDGIGVMCHFKDGTNLPVVSADKSAPCSAMCGGLSRSEVIACEPYCFGKPVIYLYPQKTTLVNVQVVTNGKIVVSDPLYPAGGWQNVKAHPDGTLFYKGKKYQELFYETLVQDYKRPQGGVVIPVSKLERDLSIYLDKLGLLQAEKAEFLAYWLPRLYDLRSPYIFFSILDQEEKQKSDRVVIDPRPDTMIEFIAYFKPVAFFYPANPLILPPKPVRRGFTAVEWGGTIE